ncbi:unnamed protein product [Rotaria sp. Silwood1]|nr:unnamed protein product [Rotaria sp. Silwood1]CAF3378073.1 unnamed protein product [Rotaria sp. Silwood1]CAF3408577.1 unnamed protein product [Rotaria sp. Silwood1]CAF3416530.1 unnamed protein product [Rotaria sp. Silwood1]CAF4635073.1 unnamed protein product [Rotaria sp. Silwood1]
MIYRRCLLLFIVVFFETISALPQYIYRHQTNSPKNNDPAYQRLSVGSNALSGSISGTYNYGAGVGPRYDSFIPIQNRPNGGGILPISYNAGSNINKDLINPNLQQQQHKNYLYNNNNAWQPLNTKNYYNQPSNRYPHGSQGWYATGGNFLYNNAQSIAAHPYLLMLSISILVICE